MRIPSTVSGRRVGGAAPGAMRPSPLERGVPGLPARARWSAWQGLALALGAVLAVLALLLGLAPYALAVAVGVIVALARVNQARARTVARLERQLTEARLGALQLQLSPHFLFNAMNLISSCIHTDTRRADTMLTHLADYLRLILRAPRSPEVALHRELEGLASYLELTRARFENRLLVEIDVTPEARAALVPYLILQPLVENAVKHGMIDRSRPAHVRISAARAGARLRLRVQDNGPGLRGEPDALGRGVGLSNTADRLAWLYAGDHQLDASDAPEGGLVVTVEIPFLPARAEEVSS